MPTKVVDFSVLSHNTRRRWWYTRAEPWARRGRTAVQCLFAALACPGPAACICVLRRQAALSPLVPCEDARRYVCTCTDMQRPPHTAETLSRTVEHRVDVRRQAARCFERSPGRRRRRCRRCRPRRQRTQAGGRARLLQSAGPDKTRRMLRFWP
jgi:hypothetical protein